MPAAPQFQSEFLRTFVARGAYYDCSGPQELDALFANERVTAYIGFDCTAKSMHIGNLVQLMTLRRLQQAGHKPILLMGGGTTKAGDPSGKDETRLILTPEQINENKQSMLSGVRHLLKFGDGPSDAIMVDNADWLDRLEYIPFLREVGRHFSVNRMLTMDSVKIRLDRDQPLSFLEFNYSLMQAYDFVELNKRFGCRLQSSGSDQWGNVVSGIDLVSNYRLPLGGKKGTWEMTFNGTYLKESTTTSFPGAPTYDCAGLYGLTCQTVNPKWRHTLRVSWVSPWGWLASAQWRYIGKVGLDSNDSNPALSNGAYDAFDAHMPAVSYIDLSGIWEVNHVLTFRAGVNNVLDKDPPIVSNAITGTGQPNAFPTYDLLGRVIFANVTLKF